MTTGWSYSYLDSNAINTWPLRRIRGVWCLKGKIEHLHIQIEMVEQAKNFAVQKKDYIRFDSYFLYGFGFAAVTVITTNQNAHFLFLYSFRLHLFNWSITSSTIDHSISIVSFFCCKFPRHPLFPFCALNFKRYDFPIQ